MPTMPSKFKKKEHIIILLHKNHGKRLRKMGKIHSFLGFVILNALDIIFDIKIHFNKF